MRNLDENDLVAALHREKLKAYDLNEVITFNKKQYTLEKVFDWAIDGVTGSRVNLAQLYFTGRFLVQDKEFAVRILENEYASLPDLLDEIKYTLATYYQDLGFYGKARDMYMSLQDTGFAPAVSRLAIMHKYGQSVQLNKETYEKKLKHAITMGHIRSRGLLAKYYINEHFFLKKATGVMLLIYNIIPAFYYAIFDKKNINQLP